MKKGQRIAAFLLLLFLVGTMAGGLAYGTHIRDAYAYDSKTAVLNEDDVYVRTDAGTGNGALKDSKGQVIFLQSGDEVIIEGEKTASDGSLWYKVSFIYSGDGNSYTGYVYGAFLSIRKDGEETGSNDKSFEEKLAAEGFPESYKTNLRQLHELYPNWEFEADYIDIDWKTALENQAIVGRSLVPSDSIFSWKSTETGAYDWKTDTWYGLDGSSWVAASRELVAYCMDPRNFLDATQIFQFEKLSYDASGHTKDGINNVIAGSFMSGGSVTNTSGASISYAQALVDAAELSGVSPYHLAARIIQEMGLNGASDSISGTVPGYEGYYNYYNIGAWAHDGYSAITNGLIYAMGKDAEEYRPWNTRYKAILGGAIILGDGYINIGQDTLYYEKFDYVGTPYTHQYMTNILAPQSEAKISAAAYTETMKKESSFVFKIPVFKNMPAAAAAKPTSDKNTNAYLNSLSVDGQKLTPAFSYTTTTYTLSVPNSVSKVTILAVAASSKATVSGAGTVSLKTGSNTVKVTVKAQSGSTKTYAITIIRAESPATTKPPETTTKAPETTTPKPTATAAVSAKTGYTVTDKKYLTGIKVGTSATNVLKKGTYTNCTAKILTSAGTAKSGSAKIATGDKLSVYKTDGSVYAAYTVVIYGDTSGDGNINVKDILLAKKHILNGRGLSGAPLVAADADKNGTINVKDLLLIKYQVLGKADIKQ